MNNILVLFRNELSTSWKRFFLIAALSGAANAAVLASLNNAAAHLHDADTRGQAFLIMVIGVLVFILAQKALLMMAANLAEGTVYRLRVELLERLRSAELPEIEALNRNQIYAAVNADMQVIAGGAPALMVIGQSALLVGMILAYVAFLSFWAFVLALGLIVLAVVLHLARSRQMQERFAEASKVETQVMDGFTDLIEGFKEVKLSTARSDELATSVRNLSESVMKSRLTARTLFATDNVISQAMFFLLTGLMVFVVPLFADVDQETLIKITTTSLFLIGPLTSAVSGIPVLQRVNAAAGSILAVESQLSAIGGGIIDGVRSFPIYDRLVMRGVTYQYPAQDKEPGFSVGPIDIEVRHGEVVFITGGNGSGKSTLLKLLTGLYLPTPRSDGKTSPPTAT
jgi:putative ATP-binding cassette transporter